MKIIKDIPYSLTNEKCTADFYFPEKKDFQTVIYFHGGGLEGGDKANKPYTEIAQSFASSGYGFVSVNYRLYPDAKFPDYLTDAAEAVAFFKEYVQKYGGNKKIMIAGQSAGAWISLMLCFNSEYLNKKDILNKDVTAWIIDSAQTTTHFNILAKERNLNPLSQRIDQAAPLYYINENTSFSRMLLIFYTNDMPCRAEQNMLLYKNILAYNPSANVEIVQLEGEHCHGSSFKDDDGEYAFVKTTFEWLDKQF